MAESAFYRFNSLRTFLSKDRADHRFIVRHLYRFSRCAHHFMVLILGVLDLIRGARFNKNRRYIASLSETNAQTLHPNKVLIRHPMTAKIPRYVKKRVRS